MKRSSRYSLTDPAVIAANRKGKMLSIQHPWLGQNLYPSQVIILVPFLIGLLTAFVLGLLFLALPSLFSNISIFALFSYIVIIFFGTAGILGSLYSLFHIITWKRLSKEPIEQAEGKITWNGQSYVAKIHERRLKPCGRMNLLPGTYCFFYLPHTGWLLSAEKLTGETQTILSLHDALIQANDFSLKAVTANREGRLSDDQIPQLEHLRSRYLVEGLLLLVINIVIVVWWKIDAVFLLVGGSIGLYLLWRGFRIASDISNRQVAAVEGIIRKTYISERSGIFHYYCINRFRFEVSLQGYNALVVGIPYRLYYVPHSKTMVNIEPLGPLLNATGRPKP